MPVNITKNNDAQFVTEFLDVLGDLTIPAGGTLTVNYTLGTTTASTDITMTALGDFFTATWASSVADHGPGTWAVAVLGSTVPVKTGELRIIGPP